MYKSIMFLFFKWIKRKYTKHNKIYKIWIVSKHAEVLCNEKNFRSSNYLFSNEFAENSLEVPYNANETSLYIELVIVIDNGMYKFLGKSLDKTHKYCKDMVNIVNSVSVYCWCAPRTIRIVQKIQLFYCMFCSVSIR